MPTGKQDSPSGSPRKSTSPAKKAAKRTPKTGDAKPPSGDEGPPGLSRNPDADPVRLHREYVQRRLGGGALPTPQAYERATDEWHQLSGSVRTPATEVPTEPEEPVLDEGPSLSSAEQRRESDESVSGETYDGPLPATDPGDNRPYEDRQS
jgi:hypothetical protein